jgi:Cys-rich repeat protein
VNQKSTFGFWIVTIFSVFLISCGDNGGGGGAAGTSCQLDSDCPKETVCQGGSCVVKGCSTADDCGDGQICVDDGSGNGTKVCTAIECISDGDCANGATCVDGLCVGGTVPQGCKSSADCPAGQTCDTATGNCAPVPPSSLGECAACVEQADCEAGLECGKVGVSNHCTRPCTQQGECASGWTCYDSDGSGAKTCVPGMFQCKDCLLDGCGDGLFCNPSNGVCEQAVATCQNCVQDAQCGPGQRCHGKETTKFCVPECSQGTCPENGTCTDVGEGIQVCEWQSAGPCCLGAGCGTPIDPCANVECPASVPYCTNGQCVECLDNSHCTDGKTCSPSKHQCVDNGPQCTGTTPFFDESKGKCCQCLNTSHCGGKTCNTTTCMCEQGSTNVCDTCADPYPGCAEFQGQWVCVQCSEDSHCPTNQCDLTSFTCAGGGPPPAQGNCGSSGCAAPLACDSGTGLCYDPTGNCDNITSFCPNGGECLDFLSMLGGGGGGLPSLPIPGGGGLPGNCTCELGPGEIPGFSKGDCPDGLTCGPGLLGIFLSLTGTTVPNTCSDGGGLPFP